MRLNEYLPELQGGIKDGNIVVVFRLGYSALTTVAVTPDTLSRLADEKVRIIVDQSVRESLQSAVRDTLVRSTETRPQDVRLGFQLQNEGGTVLHEFYVAPPDSLGRERLALIDGKPVRLRGALITWCENLLDQQAQGKR